MTAALIAAWISSAWYILDYTNYNAPGHSLIFACGRIIASWDSQYSAPPSITRRITFETTPIQFVGSRPFYWKFEFYSGAASPTQRTLMIPGWSLVLAAGIPAAYLWISDERRRRALLNRGKCMRCKFDLAGLPVGAKCPECGSLTMGAAPALACED